LSEIEVMDTLGAQERAQAMLTEARLRKEREEQKRKLMESKIEKSEEERRREGYIQRGSVTCLKLGSLRALR
jgi:hypothetical protein